ncbi:MAG: stress response protein, partial [Candidatus Dormiibacterota bacterium]
MAVLGEQWQRARLLPVTGIGGTDEQERRCCSALLSVIEAVQEFGRALTMRVGAPAGTAVAFIEVPFHLDGKRYRPDGLIQVSRGQRRWTALVEVKTGHNRLDPGQVATYLDIAREQGYDLVLTISHEIPTTPGVHPVQVDGRKLRKVALAHLSWGQIHTEALLEQVNRAVADPDQAWILSEFIRYLEDPKSGALDFDDMGPSWVTVRESSANQTLRAGDQQTVDVVARFDQLVTFAGMALSRRVGVQVKPVLSRKELAEQAVRLQTKASELAKTGQLTGSLQIPNAVAPLEICVDLRANRVDCAATVQAPADGRPATRINWLLRQLQGAPPHLQVRANTVWARQLGASCRLAELADDRKLLIGDPRAEIRSFTLTLSQSAGTKRGQGRGSFVNSVT